MTEKLMVESERVDDIPVLMAHQVRMGVPDLLDRHFGRHGNRQGLSLGWLTSMWLTYILSESDHRMSHVRVHVGIACRRSRPHCRLPRPRPSPTDFSRWLRGGHRQWPLSTSPIVVERAPDRLLDLGSGCGWPYLHGQRRTYAWGRISKRISKCPAVPGTDSKVQPAK